MILLRLKRSFNGATPFQTWKCFWSSPPQRRPYTLQWGHAFSDVEITVYRIAAAAKRIMLQWGHAFSDVEMSSTKWTSTSRSSLQWGHAFSDVEIRDLSKDVNSEGFKLQWGHAFSDVEMFRANRRSRSISVASMGPRLFRRGNLNFQPHLQLVLPCFNGATPFQTWKFGRSIGDQKGSDRASMGPRLFRRGNFDKLVQRGMPLASFNGATPFQTWKYGEEEEIPEEIRAASMGPRLFRRGNLMQWTTALERLLASMGPRLFRRGNAASDFNIEVQADVSFNGATPFQTWKLELR